MNDRLPKSEVRGVPIPSSMAALICRRWCRANNLTVETVPVPRPGPSQVLVEVAATAVNYADNLLIAGRYQDLAEPPFSPGMETTGIVRACGARVTRLHPGQRVMAIVNNGGMAEYCIVESDNAISLPADMPLQDAGAFPGAYLSAHVAIRWQGQLRSGETLLVLGAGGGIGLAAVEIGKAMGARVIAAASTAEKLAAAKSRGADITINYAREDLKKAVSEATGGAGVEICFDPVGGALFDTALSALAWGGRIVIVGFVAGIPDIPANRLLVKNRSAIGSSLRYFQHFARDKFHKSGEELLEHYSAGQLRPLVSAMRPLSEAADAIAALAERRAHGRTLILLKDHTA